MWEPGKGLFMVGKHEYVCMGTGPRSAVTHVAKEEPGRVVLVLRVPGLRPEQGLISILITNNKTKL